ncbi:putative double-stranded RNA/RNA-DNA hybrid binding protein [Lachnospiraceae bacterium JC7]|nr:putative double-stranded RNA/RNA-DNA hybrid binding protein [Lachnospiraceae bacterium JC7]
MAFFYAVQKGKKPGVYSNWNDCKAQVMGYPGAVYKKFSTRGEAEAFAAASGGYGSTSSANVKGTGAGGSFSVSSTGMSARSYSGSSSGSTGAAASGPQFHSVSDVKPEDIVAEFSDVETEALAYVDGSYNVRSKKFGYGGILMKRDGSFETMQGSGTDPSLASMRNVAGEIHGSMAAIRTAKEHGIKSITVFYDYMGIEMWANGQWKANKEGTIEYKAFVAEMRNHMEIKFCKVAAHTGVRFNELVDKLAKGSVGIM